MRLTFPSLASIALFAFLAQSQLVNTSNANELPPAGAVDASCIYASQAPNFCKVRIDRTNKTILVWYPEGRQSAMNAEYTGNCLNEGCILTGPDYGYPQREKSIIVEFTDQILSWRELNANKELHVFKFLK